MIPLLGVVADLESVHPGEDVNIGALMLLLSPGAIPAGTAVQALVRNAVVERDAQM